MTAQVRCLDPDQNSAPADRLILFMRHFLLGILCSILLMGVIGAAFVLRQEPAHQRSTTDSALYDTCLAERNGNIEACDALMRIIERERDVQEVMIREAARLLAAGFSKREVVEWAAKKGFKGKQLSDAVGISLQDLEVGKY